MRFTYKETEYVISFEHHNNFKTVPQILFGVLGFENIGHEEAVVYVELMAGLKLAVRKQKQSFTRCLISSVDRSTVPATEVPFVIGEARLRTGEQYCKSTGRSYAFNRAVELLGDQAMRDLAAAAYENRTKKKEGATS